MFIIFLLFVTSSLANSHEKYIDLLSDAEKQAFLNKVARRILDTVESTKKAGKSVEIDDEELKKHDTFVKNILKEESGRVRKRRDSESSAEESGSDLEVKPIENNVNDESKKDSTVNKSSETEDSTLTHEIKRRSNDEVPQESSKEYIKVEIVTGDVIPVNSATESIKTEESSKKQRSEEVTTSSSVTHADVKENVGATIDPNSKVEESNDQASYARETDYDSGKVDKQDDNDKAESVDKNTPKTIEESKPIKDDISNTKNVQREVQAEDITVQIETTNEAILITTDKKYEDHSAKPIVDNNSPIANVATTYSSIGITEPTTKLADVKDPTIATTDATIIELTTNLINDATTASNKADSSNDQTAILKQRGVKVDEATTTKYDGLTPSVLTSDVNKDTTKRPRKEIKKKIVNLHSLQDIKKSKSVFDLLNSVPNKNLNRKDCDGGKVPYQVYEIPWPALSNDTTFLRGEVMENQPLSIPVYKYAPNLAFYNPKNLRGPNAEEKNSEEATAINLREGNAEAPKPNEFILDLNEELRKFGAYHKVAPEYAPEAPHTTDTPGESEEHTVIKFPDSNERLHPFNTMKNGLKSHLIAVRDILHEKKIFHPIGPTGKHEYIKELYGNTDILDKYPETGDSNEVVQPHHKKRASLRLRSHNDRNRDFDITFVLAKNIHRGRTKGFHRFQGAPSDDVETHDVIVMGADEDNNVNNQISYHPQETKVDETGNYSTIAKILSISDEKDVFIHLEKLQELNLKLMRRNEDAKLGIYMKVLKRLIQEDSQSLKQYDWLATTVQIQSSLEKLFKLIDRRLLAEPLHPADVQILKYVLFMHNFSLELRGANLIKNKLKEEKPLPKVRIKRKNKKAKSVSLNQVWLYLNKLLPDLTVTQDLKKLKELLSEINDSLFDLHEAITNIAKVTDFKQQNWFENLKDLYLTTDEKHLRELILHISFSRLIDLIENSCENGLEKDFIKYMKTHKKESKRTLEEMIFVLKILDEIKSNLE